MRGLKSCTTLSYLRCDHPGNVFQAYNHKQQRTQTCGPPRPLILLSDGRVKRPQLPAWGKENKELSAGGPALETHGGASGVLVSHEHGLRGKHLRPGKNHKKSPGTKAGFHFTQNSSFSRLSERKTVIHGSPGRAEQSVP